MRRIAVLACVLLAGSACGGPTSEGAPPSVTTVVSPSAAASPSAEPKASPTSGGAKPAAPSWPTPEDCISYSPSKAAVRYDTGAGAFVVEAGSAVVMRLYGDNGSDLGDKGLALAKRYNRHCFLGRKNTREEKVNYVFDYWRGQVSGAEAVPGQEDDCSTYDRGNLTVEDMGNGDGWRVKDHDNVLHLFDNERDARNGKLVLSKYKRMCSLGDDGDGQYDRISYQA
jgi:hypothetical protein